MIENIILIAVIGLIVGAAVGYIVKAKRRGQKCIGCPYGTQCALRQSGCGCEQKKK